MLKRKILFIFVHLRFGGAEVGLLTTLKNLNRDKFDCTVISIEKKGEIAEEIEKIGFNVICLNQKARLYNLSLIVKIYKLLKKIQPDILHTSLFYANYFGRIAALFKRPKVVISEERSVYTEKKFYHCILDWLLSFKTTRIIVCSKSVLEFTKKQECINQNKFYLIYNAPDIERFNVSTDKNDIRKEFHLLEDDFIVGSVGSLISKKGHDLLLKACIEVNQQIPNIKLVLAGAGNSSETLKKIALDNQFSGLFLLGAQKNVPAIMKMLDIFVLPSLQEGFPRTLLEAMYSGLPVIASDISGIPEVVINNENGLLIKPGSIKAISASILRLYKNEALRNKLSLRAKSTIEDNLTPEKCTNKLENLYMELLAN